MTGYLYDRYRSNKARITRTGNRAYSETPCCRRRVIVDFADGEGNGLRHCRTCGHLYLITTDGETATFEDITDDLAA